MMSRIAIYLILLMLAIYNAPVSALDDGMRTVSGEATWYDDGSLSRLECMRRALENARLDALSKNFGTIISQDIIQSDRISNGRESNDFLSLSSTEVKGEWISDIGEPIYEFSRDADQNLIVTCRVKGKAKPVSNEAMDFLALVLRNGEREVNADTHFIDGDELKLLFSAPADGYLNVFLEDETGSVFGLLPYPRDPKSEVHVKKDRKYLFFKGNDNEFGPSDEIILTAPHNMEYNRMYVVFSPSSFSRPVMQADPAGLPSLKSDSFSKWLVKSRRKDPKMGVKAINLQIIPKDF